MVKQMKFSSPICSRALPRLFAVSLGVAALGSASAQSVSAQTATTPPISGTCTPARPYIQPFNSAGPLAEVRNHSYLTDPNAITFKDGTYTLWNGIDNTGNGGYALYMNIANFAGNNGATLATPGLLYESTINVPAGSTLNYQNYVRSHSNTATQIRYIFTDTASGTVLKQYDGALATTNYTLQSVPSFTAPGSQVTLRLYTLKDGTSADANVLKLDDLKLSCTAPVAYPQLSIAKTGNGPWTAGQSGATYNLTVTNTSTVATNGTITVQDQLPDGITMGTPALPSGWTAAVSGQLVTLTNSTGILSAGGSVTFNLPVNVSSSAASTITNKASVGGGGDPDPIPTPSTCTPGSTNPNNQCASYTTTVTVPPTTPAVCTNMYAMVITGIVKDSYGNPILYNGGKIQRLDETTNTLTGNTITLPSGATSATLAVAPDGSKFYTADDSYNLRIYNTSSNTWSTGGYFSGVGDRLVRMAVTPGGTGYAMDSRGNFWSFTASGTVTALGKLTATSTTAPNFYANGDFFSTSDGKLYLLSAQTGGTVSLWYVNPVAKTAEYLGDLTSAASNVQYNGIAATPNGIFAANSAGNLGKVDPVAVTISSVGGTNTGSTDLTSCYYPDYKPILNAVKSVAKVGGSAGTDVRPGDTLEYTVTIRNSGNLPAGGVLFRDALPAGTTYVADSAKINGFTSTNTAGTTISLAGTTYPFSGTKGVGICSKGSSACTNQVLKPDTTPNTIDNEAVVTFRVTVNPGVSSVTNQAVVTYNDGNTPPTDIPSNPVTTPVVPLPLAQCTNLYGLMMTPGSAAYPAYGTSIQLIGDTNNVLGATVATLPNGQTSATLAVSPDGSKFFTAADTSTNSMPLLVYTTATGQWTTGGTFTLGSSTDRLVRMGVTKDGTGYAMDSAGKLYSFQTVAPYGVTALGQVTSNSSGAPALSWNGDMFASDKGLYMLSSVDGTASIDLWLINPTTRNAEYLGRLSDPGQTNAQYNGFAATPNGVFGRDNYGRLVKIDLQNVTLVPVGTPTNGSTDLTSCFYPSFAPNIAAIKTVKKVAGTTGTDVYPGDTLEYTITVRNSGDLPAGGVTFQDALPVGTTYVADSAKINGATTTVTSGAATNLAGAAYPFTNPVGICSNSIAPCTTQVLKIDSTPNTIDNEAVITFRVKVVDPFTLNPSQVANQAFIKYTDGPNGGVPSDDPTTPTPNDPTITPVVKPAKLIAEKTVQNITANGPIGVSSSGKPGDVLEYCIKTSNVGSANATNIRFGDNVPANTNFLVNAYGAGKDIHVTTSTGTDVHYTSTQDADAGALISGRVTVNGGTFVLQPTQTFTVCFRATIQ